LTNKNTVTTVTIKQHLIYNILHVSSQEGHHQASYIQPENGYLGLNMWHVIINTMLYSKLQLCLTVFLLVQGCLYNTVGCHASKSHKIRHNTCISLTDIWAARRGKWKL